MLIRMKNKNFFRQLSIPQGEKLIVNSKKSVEVCTTSNPFESKDNWMFAVNTLVLPLMVCRYIFNSCKNKLISECSANELSHVERL
jgi:hypothetical protein